MAIVTKVELGSATRRVKLKQPKNAEPVLAYERLTRELIIISAGTPDNDLPPEPGIPEFPGNELPEEPPVIDNILPDFSVDWPGCSGHVDNTLPEPPDYVWGGAPSTPDNELPGDQPEVGDPSFPTQQPAY